MNLTSKYIEDENGVKFAPISTPNAIRWPDGSNLNDKLGSISYNDLTDKPTIPAAQIQSDWNQSDNIQKDFIKNKPTTMGASGSGHKGGLVPDTPSTQGTTKFLCEDGTWKTTPATDISGKADKVNNATSGNFAALDSNGNLTDSGHKHSDYLTSHQDISGKEDVTTIVAPVNTTDATLPITSLTTEVGKYYRIDVPVETLAVTLPAMTDLTTIRTVIIYLTTGSTPNITFTASVSPAPAVYAQDKFIIEASKTYEINAIFNGDSWVIVEVEINKTDITPSNE